MCAVRRCLIALGAVGAAACSGPQVRMLGNGDGPPAFELRGASLAAVQAEAGRRCAQGYQVLRVAERYARPEPEDNATTRWFQQAGDWLSGMPGNEAQATIVCRS